MAVSDFIGTEHHKERYAFLWRNTIVSVLSPPQLLHDHQDVFVREPFIGYFKAGMSSPDPRVSSSTIASPLLLGLIAPSCTSPSSAICALRLLGILWFDLCF